MNVFPTESSSVMVHAMVLVVILLRGEKLNLSFYCMLHEMSSCVSSIWLSNVFPIVLRSGNNMSSRGSGMKTHIGTLDNLMVDSLGMMLYSCQVEWIHYLDYILNHSMRLEICSLNTCSPLQC